MPKFAVVMACLIGSAPLAMAQTAPADPWSQVRFLLGEWRGSLDGEQGKGTVTRTFRLILSGRFLQEKSLYDFPPQPLQPNGLVSSHASFMTAEPTHAITLYRQTHQEHLNGTFVLSKTLSGPAKLVFELEPPADAPVSSKVRETWEVVSPDTFVEIREVAPNGQPFAVQSRIQFKRRQP